MSAAERAERLPRFRARRSAPNSWGALLALACIAVFGAAVCGFAIQRYLASRPLDLRARAKAVSARVEEILAREIATPSKTVKPWNTAAALGSTTRFDIAAPATFRPKTLEQKLRALFTDGRVTVTELAGQAGGTRAYAIDSGGFDVATVYLSGTDDRADYIDETSSLAAATVAALRDVGSIAVDTLRNEPREDAAARWQFAEFKAEFGVGGTAQNIADALNARLENARAVATVNPNDATQLDLAYANVPFATVHITNRPPSDTGARLASFAMQLSGLNPDDTVVEKYADPEELPLDSSDLADESTAPPIGSMRAPYTGPLRLAIILDDGGYGGTITEDILAMPTTLTLSILPHTPFGKETARRAVALGFEVMLHMPMENISGKTTFPGQITVDMTEKRMLALTNAALADVPGAVGINNHTGSKFTSDPAAMRAFLKLIKDRGLFFIDSRTAKTACAYQVADEMAIPTAARDLFLDHESGTDYIRARFAEIIEIVKRQGSAIAICHFRRNTVPILKEMLPVFEQEGIQIVHASEMVH